MCRLFGMSGGSHRVRSTFWLLDAPDSISAQSHRDPDGTGLGFFDRRDDAVVHRLPLPAYEDREFRWEARHVSSRTFVAHVRFASGSPVSLENTHPFEQHNRLFAHNGVVRGLDELESELGDFMSLVEGQTDSERVFALISREIERADGDVERGIRSAIEWVAERLPIYALNFVLTTAQGVWALRYPETHRLFLLENATGSRLHSRLMRVHMQDHARAAVVASEKLDDDAGWRLLEPGELVHIAPDLTVRSSIAFPHPPAHPIRRADLHPQEAASQTA